MPEGPSRQAGRGPAFYRKESTISRKVFAGNLNFDIDREQLIEAFSVVGSVVDVVVPIDRNTGRKRGFAFVEFETEEAAAKAIETLDGTDLAGRTLRVDEARDRPPRAPRAGGDFLPPLDPPRRPYKNKGSRRNIRRRKRGF